MSVPRWTRGTGQLIIASAIGINLTPPTLALLAGNVGLMLAGGAALIMASAMIALMLTKICRMDQATALFSTLPGGPMELALVAERYGGHPELVAFSQMLRIAVIVTLVPLLLMLAGHTNTPVGPPLAEGDLLRLAVILGIGTACAVCFHSFGVMNAYFLGPLLGVGLATLAGLPGTAFPWTLLTAAQVLLGTALGAMFTSNALHRASRFLVNGIWVACLITLIGVAIGLAAAWWTGQQPGLLVLANAPGGAAEMAVLAQSLALDAALVSGYHLVRIVMIVPTAELIFHVFKKATRHL
jgi:membrane AbrB-like protein